MTKLYKIKYIPAWEPSAAKVTPAVYPHLNDFTEKLNFRY